MTQTVHGISKKEVLAILDREEEDIIERAKDVFGKDYNGTADALASLSESDVVNDDEKKAIAEWTRVRNIYLAVSNISEL